MKYSMKSLDMAIDTLLPTIAQAKQEGINFNRADLLKWIAVDFMLDYPFVEGCNTKTKMICYHIAREALLDLKECGQFNFGDMELVNLKAK